MDVQGGKETAYEHKYNEEEDMEDVLEEDHIDQEEKEKSQKGQLQLTELEMLRVETFFRGNQTQVFVGKSLVNLYLRTAKSLVGLNRCSSQPDVCSRTLQRQHNRVTDWQLKFTGIPVRYSFITLLSSFPYVKTISNQQFRLT